MYAACCTASVQIRTADNRQVKSEACFESFDRVLYQPQKLFEVRIRQKPSISCSKKKGELLRSREVRKRVRLLCRQVFFIHTPQMIASHPGRRPHPAIASASAVRFASYLLDIDFKIPYHKRQKHLSVSLFSLSIHDTFAAVTPKIVR